MDSSLSYLRFYTLLALLSNIAYFLHYHTKTETFSVKVHGFRCELQSFKVAKETQPFDGYFLQRILSNGTLSRLWSKVSQDKLSQQEYSRISRRTTSLKVSVLSSSYSLYFIIMDLFFKFSQLHQERINRNSFRFSALQDFSYWFWAYNGIPRISEYFIILLQYLTDPQDSVQLFLTHYSMWCIKMF